MLKMLINTLEEILSPPPPTIFDPNLLVMVVVSTRT